MGLFRTHRTCRVIGILALFLSLSWFLIPCEVHCASPVGNPVQQGCSHCQPKNDTSPTTSHTEDSTDGLKLICSNMYSSLLIPSKIQPVPVNLIYHTADIVVLKSVSIEQDKNPYLNRIIQVPIKTSQVFAVQQYPPHSPPISAI